MSDQGSFSQCLVDGDLQSLERAQQLRRKALLASIILEATLVAAMLLWPLITPGVLPRQFFVTPAPPYHGGPNPPATQPRGGAHTNANTRHRAVLDVFRQPPRIPPHVQDSADSGAPEISSGPGSGAANIPGGEGPGYDQPGGSEFNGQPLPIKLPAKPEKPRLMSEGVMEAALIHKVQPEYPAVAKLMRLAGTVRLRAIIGKDGSVRELQVLSGNPILAQSALAAVREWRYQPTRLNSEAVEVETYVTVNFILE
jgi:periplasmic protein TonB